MTDNFCNICEERSLSRLLGFEELPRVTSDCKPWPAGGTLFACETCGAIQKRADQFWLDEVQRIYDAYDIYQLSSGSEQIIFNREGCATPRSQTLTDHFISSVELPSQGKLFDIGCGNGAALLNFSRRLPNWSFCGSELSDGALETLENIPGFDTLYTASLDVIPARFDVVSMIHSLEHMPAPYECLTNAVELLKDTGTLLIEVPNIESSLFDILIADHLSHFSIATLDFLSRRSGLQILECSDQVLPKEITLIGIGGKTRKKAGCDSNKRQVTVKRNIAWLHDLLTSARTEAAHRKVGIFGTSISAMWLYGAIERNVAFFVDEDTTRIGKSIQGRPILSPRDVQPGESVFVPLVPPSAANVIQRLSALPIHFIAPPIW